MDDKLVYLWLKLKNSAEVHVKNGKLNPNMWHERKYLLEEYEVDISEFSLGSISFCDARSNTFGFFYVDEEGRGLMNNIIFYPFYPIEIIKKMKELFHEKSRLTRADKIKMGKTPMQYHYFYEILENELVSINEKYTDEKLVVGSINRKSLKSVYMSIKKERVPLASS